MAQKTSKAKQAQYSKYANSGSYSKNKKRKLIKHLAKFPNDAQALTAFGNIGSTGRKKPNTPKWSASAIEVAKLYGEFKRARNVFENSPSNYKKQLTEVRKNFKTFFSLGFKLEKTFVIHAGNLTSTENLG